MNSWIESLCKGIFVINRNCIVYIILHHWNNYLWNATIITIYIISYTTIFDISYLFFWLRILLQYFLSIIRVYMMAFNIFVINQNCIVYIILHHLNLPIIWNNYVWNSIIITIHIISYTKIFVTIFHIYFCG